MAYYGPEVTQKVLDLIDAGKSQGEVHRLTGVPQPTISRWLKERREAPPPTPRKHNATQTKVTRTQTQDTPDDNIVTIPADEVRLPSVDVPTNGNVATTTLQRVEIVGEPVKVEDGVDLKAHIDVLATEVAELKAHRLEVDAWIAQSLDGTQTRAALRSAAHDSIAQASADPAQTWDDPDDAKSVPFNLSLPRGLKRLLDAEAKRTGFPASRLVQRLLIAALRPEGGSHDA